MTKFKIVSDGTVHGTKVVFVDAFGYEHTVDSVVSVDWWARTPQKNTWATLVIRDVPLEVDLPADFVKIMKSD